MKAWILGIWLGIQGCIDFKYKMIPLWLSVVGAVLGAGFCIMEKRDVESILWALVPGILAMIFSKLTNEVMGYGDGITLMVLGVFLPLERIVSIGMLAFVIAGVAALFLLVVFRKKGSYRIPFVPFLAVAYVMDCFIK